jgi:hypothetical protein
MRAKAQGKGVIIYISINDYTNIITSKIQAFFPVREPRGCIASSKGI